MGWHGTAQSWAIPFPFLTFLCLCCCLTLSGKCIWHQNLLGCGLANFPSIQEHLLAEFPLGKTELTAFLKITAISFSLVLLSHKEMSPCGQKSLFPPQLTQLNGVEPGYEPAELQTTIWRERLCTSHQHQGRCNWFTNKLNGFYVPIFHALNTWQPTRTLLLLKGGRVTPSRKAQTHLQIFYAVLMWNTCCSKLTTGH